jgi:hypothetical protein
LAEPLDKGRTGRLARFGQSKEDLLQDRVSFEVGITEILCDAGLIEVHNVFPTSGGHNTPDFQASQAAIPESSASPTLNTAFYPPRSSNRDLDAIE